MKHELKNGCESFNSFPLSTKHENELIIDLHKIPFSFVVVVYVHEICM